MPLGGKEAAIEYASLAFWACIEREGECQEMTIALNQWQRALTHSERKLSYLKLVLR